MIWIFWVSLDSSVEKRKKMFTETDQLELNMRVFIMKEYLVRFPFFGCKRITWKFRRQSFQRPIYVTLNPPMAINAQKNNSTRRLPFFSAP